MQRLHALAQPIVGTAAFDRERPLGDRRQHLFGRQDRPRRPFPSEPDETAPSEQRRIDLTGGELFDPPIDIAPERHDPEVGPAPQQLRLAAQRRGADDGLLRQCRDCRRFRRQKSLARIVARQYASDLEPRRQPGFEILQGMHRQIDAAVEQRLLDLFGKKPLAADLGEAAVLLAVAAGADRHDLDPVREIRMGGEKPVAHEPRLEERHRAAAGADAQWRSRHLAIRCRR